MRIKWLRDAIICFIIAAIGIWLMGCASLSTMERECGRKYVAKAFSRIDETPDLYYQTTILVTFHLCGNWKMFPETARRKEVAGCASVILNQVTGEKTYHIWTRAKKTPHGIIFDFCNKGHECGHLLNWASDGKILDPDKLKELGY